MTLQALIFDVDGTLAETEELHRAAFNHAFAAANLPWHWSQADYRTLLQVTGGKERIAHAIAQGARPTLTQAGIAALHAEKTRRYAALVAAGHITLRPGIEALLNEAAAANLPVAIATTTTPANVTALLHATLGPGGPARFAFIAAGDMVPHKKPAPDIYHLALAQLVLPPDACLAIEDTPNGLHSARAAGIPTLITTSLYGGTTGFDGALAVIASLDHPHTTLSNLRGWHAARPLP